MMIIKKIMLFALVAAAITVPKNSLAFRNIKVGEKLQNVELNSLAGERVSVLSSEVEVNLFLFFRPNQEHSQTALKILTKVCTQLPWRSVRFIAVVSDYYKSKVIEDAIRKAGWNNASTLIDHDDHFYGELGVSLHPTFGIADSSFTLMAYEPFSEINYFQRIYAHVEYALEDIDIIELEYILNPPVEDQTVATNHASPHLNYARMLVKAGKLDKALEQAKETLALDDHLANAHSLIGTIYARQNKCGKARPEFDKALAIDRNNQEAIKGKRFCK